MIKCEATCVFCNDERCGLDKFGIDVQMLHGFCNSRIDIEAEKLDTITEFFERKYKIDSENWWDVPNTAKKDMVEVAAAALGVSRDDAPAVEEVPTVEIAEVEATSEDKPAEVEKVRKGIEILPALEKALPFTDKTEPEKPKLLEWSDKAEAYLECTAQEDNTDENSKKKQNYGGRPQCLEITDELEKELYDMYIVHDISTTKIAKKYDVSKMTIYNVMNKIGLTQLKKTMRAR